MSYPRTPTTTTSAATTTPNATPNEHYDASPATPTVSATPSASTPSKPHNSPNAASLTAIFDAVSREKGAARAIRARGRVGEDGGGTCHRESALCDDDRVQFQLGDLRQIVGQA